jgi:hypothetical protein
VALPTNPLFAIEAVPFLSRFDAAVKAAGLDKILSADTFEGTVFVPVDLVSAGHTAPAIAAVMLLKCLTMPLLPVLPSTHLMPGTACSTVQFIRAIGQAACGCSALHCCGLSSKRHS